MAVFLHYYLLVATALIAVSLLGFLLYPVGQRIVLVATFLLGAGGERRHLAILDLKLRALKWLAAMVARYERERAARK